MPSLLFSTLLHHAEKEGNYLRMLFVDFSSPFNATLPNILMRKPTDLDLLPLACDCINSFLTDHPQTVRVGTHTPSTRTLDMGSLQAVC